MIFTGNFSIKRLFGEGWSVMWKPPENLMTVDTDMMIDGFQVLGITVGRFRNRFYTIAICEDCNGKFLTSRIDTMYCSKPCCARHKRRVS